MVDCLLRFTRSCEATQLLSGQRGWMRSPRLGAEKVQAESSLQRFFRSLRQRVGACGFSLRPNAVIVGFLQENAANNKSHAGNNHRVIKPRIDIAGSRDRRKSNERQQPSKHSVAYMVRQRNG